MKQRSIERAHNFTSEELAQWVIDVQLGALFFDFLTLAFVNSSYNTQ